METFSLQALDRPTREALVQELGFVVEEGWIHERNGQPYRDPFTRIPVHVDRMMMMPGSVVILDDNPISLLCYLHRYGRTLDDLVLPA